MSLQERLALENDSKFDQAVRFVFPLLVEELRHHQFLNHLLVPDELHLQITTPQKSKVLFLPHLIKIKHHLTLTLEKIELWMPQI